MSDTRVPLACTVRSCGRPLTRDGRRFACPEGHAFDIARSGYVSLLQPQDRRSRDAGDTQAAVDARARWADAGLGRTLIDAAIDAAAPALPATPAPIAVDLGCGSGDALATLAERWPALTAIGIDLSVHAIERAARRAPRLTWVVANADRRLPLLDGAIDLIWSIHGRRQPAECARVLRPRGRLVVAVPAADDLVELRARVAGTRVERDRVDGVLADHDALFALVDRRTVRERHTLTGQLLEDLLAGTYRGARHSAAAQVAALDTLDVTLASDVLVFERR